VEVVADGPHHDFTRIEPDPDADRDAVRLLDLVSVTLDPILHSQRRIAGPDGVVLVREWRVPAGEPWATLLLVHGLAEHSGRYEHVAVLTMRSEFDTYVERYPKLAPLFAAGRINLGAIVLMFENHRSGLL